MNTPGTKYSVLSILLMEKKAWYLSKINHLIMEWEKKNNSHK